MAVQRRGLTQALDAIKHSSVRKLAKAVGLLARRAEHRSTRAGKRHNPARIANLRRRLAHVRVLRAVLDRLNVVRRAGIDPVESPAFKFIAGRFHCVASHLTIRSSRARFAVSARFETSGQRAGLTQVLAPMKVFPALLIGLAFYCTPAASIACSPSPMNENIARKLDAVFIGEVTTSNWDATTYQLSVTVKVQEVVKGKGSDQIVALLPCFQSVENGRRVIVFVKDGNPVAWHSEYYENDIRRALRRGR